MIQELKTRLLIKRERHRVIRRRVRGIRESDKEIENLSLRPLFYYQQATEVVSFFCLSPEHMLKNHIHISVFSVNIKSTVNTQKCVFFICQGQSYLQKGVTRKALLCVHYHQALFLPLYTECVLLLQFPRNWAWGRCGWVSVYMI